MPDTYRCKDCGYTAETGADYPPATCPKCGGDELLLYKAETAPQTRWPWDRAPEPPKEGD